MYEKLIPSLQLPCFSLSFADNSELFNQLCISDLQAVAKHFESLFQGLPTDCIVGPFGENRSQMLQAFACKDMLDAKRVMHLGLDLITMTTSRVTTPLTGRVVLSQNEQGAGQFGGLLVLESNFRGQTLYLLFGHLDPALLPKLGQTILQGETLGQLGKPDVNGGWLEHLHFQLMTEEGYKAGFANLGYGKIQDINKYVLDPVLVLQ